MSQQNHVSVNIPDANAAAINAAIGVLREKLLPCLKTLKPEEKKEFLKMGDKSIAFVQKALEHCDANTDLVPPFLNLNDFKRDYGAVESLRLYLAPLEQIVEGLTDTMLLAGSEAFSAALMFYDSVKSAKKTNVVKANAIFDDLSKRFPHRKRDKVEIN